MPYLVIVSIVLFNTPSNYIWTDDAINSKLVCTNESFTLKESFSTVTASGKLINCTNTTIEVNKGEIIIYCQDTSTNETYSFKNLISYKFAPEEETVVSIPINSDYQSEILKNYRIVKIEYHPSEKESYILNTLIETGSYLIPWAEIIVMPIVIAIIISTIFFAVYKKKTTNEQCNGTAVEQKTDISESKITFKNTSLIDKTTVENETDVIKLKTISINLPFTQKLIILIVNLLTYIGPIIAWIIAFKYNQWTAKVLTVVVVFVTIGLLANLSFMCVVIIRQILTRKKQLLEKKNEYELKLLNKRIEKDLQNLIESKELEIKIIQEKLLEEKTQATSKEKELANELNSAIELHKSTIRQNEQKISKHRSRLNSKQHELLNLEDEIKETKKENLDLEIKNLQSLDGWQFEKYCSTLFSKLGYSVRMTSGSGDFGADLILNNEISVQCKLYSNPVGLRALQEVYSSMARYKTTSACVVTNSTFTRQAIEYAQDAGIKLIDCTTLKLLIEKVLASNKEVEEKEAAKFDELRNEIAKIKKEIKSVSTIITKEKKKIDDLKISINEMPEIKALRKQVQNHNKQSEQRITDLSNEIQEIRLDLSSLNSSSSTTNEISKKYNLL